MKLDLDGLNADFLTSMLKASFSLENWGAMIEIADRLITQIAFIYETSSDTLREQNLKRSIPYYFGFSLCSKGIARKSSVSILRLECVFKNMLNWAGSKD